VITPPSSGTNKPQMGAVQFIENLDRTTLTISDEEFEQNVEAAVSAIAEKHEMEAAQAAPPQQLWEKAAPNRSDGTPRPSSEAESSTTRKSNAPNEHESSDGIDEKAAMSGLLRTIQQPFSTIGRIFSEDTSSPQGPPRTPLSGNSPRSAASPRISTDRPRSPQRSSNVFETNTRSKMTAEDSAARQASAEAAEAQRIQRAEHSNVVETLAGMFPDLDREIISDVVTQKEGRVGLAVDACLALSS
jgi:Rab5 GDP/GTP exchange factor